MQKPYNPAVLLCDHAILLSQAEDFIFFRFFEKDFQDWVTEVIAK
jgi:hypothetical protein